MSKLDIVCATLHQPEWMRCVASWDETTDFPHDIRVIAGKPLIEAYQSGYEFSGSPVIGFLHDDLIIHEQGWDNRALREFNDFGVGLVGFGGALGHGDVDLYRKPYELPQLARRKFLSNMRNAEANGTRFTGSYDVAVLDGFALFVRRQILEKTRGWPQEAGYFMYSEWLCCETRRQGYRIRLVGVDCDHLSGKSTGMGPQKLGREDFEAAHRWLYDNNRDVLPYTVKE